MLTLKFSKARPSDDIPSLLTWPLRAVSAVLLSPLVLSVILRPIQHYVWDRYQAGVQAEELWDSSNLVLIVSLKRHWLLWLLCRMLTGREHSELYQEFRVGIALHMQRIGMDIRVIEQ